MNILKALITIKKLENKPLNVQYSRTFGYIYKQKGDKVFKAYCDAYNYLYQFPLLLKFLKWVRFI